MAELQLAKRFDMLEGWRNAIAAAVGRGGFFILWVAAMGPILLQSLLASPIANSPGRTFGDRIII
jgi:hypothetical protein